MVRVLRPLLFSSGPNSTTSHQAVVSKMIKQVLSLQPAYGEARTTGLVKNSTTNPRTSSFPPFQAQLELLLSKPLTGEDATEASST